MNQLPLRRGPHACRFLRFPIAVLEQLRVYWPGSTGELTRDMPWSGTVTELLSVSLVVAQRLRKLDFPVKDSEEPSAPGADKNHFLRPRGPGEDTRKVSATDTLGPSSPSSWTEVWVEGSQHGLVLKHARQRSGTFNCP